MSSMSSAAERVAAQQRLTKGNLLSCKRCGGKYFHEERSTRRLAGGIGSVENLVDPESQEFLVTICSGCGFPVTPKPATGRRANGIYETGHKEFRESISVGQDALNALDPKAAADAVAAHAADKGVESDVKDLQVRVGRLESPVPPVVEVKNERSTQ